MTLGEQIKQAREDKNYSQEELANKIEVSRQAISKWENGVAVPTGINREMLNQVLGIELYVDENQIPKERKSVMGIVGWVISGILAILLLITLIYIKTRLPLLYDHSTDINAQMHRYEIELSQEIKEHEDENILAADVRIEMDEKDEVASVKIMLACKNEPSSELEQMIFDTVENKILIEKENIYIESVVSDEVEH